MDKNILEIKSYEGKGYKPLIFFGAWRVAILNTPPADDPWMIERHLKTDEVFVLTQGKATLVIGGKGKLKVKKVVMKKNVIYNVRKAVWHTVIMSNGAKILIVENADTSAKNGEIQSISKKRLGLV